MKQKPLFIFLFLLNLCLFFIFFVTNHFPKPLMLVNFLSSLSLWIYVLKNPYKKFKTETLIAMVLFLVTIIVGLYRVEEITPGMYGDEVTLGRYALKTIQLEEAPPFYGEYSPPTPLLYLAGASIEALGRRPLAVKLPSIILGAVSVAAFFVLLRLFFKNFYAAIGAVLFLTSYSNVVLYRLGYEMPGTVLFFILTAIFFKLTTVGKNPQYVLGLGLSLAGGLYTYLSFRPFFLVMGTIICLYFLKKRLSKSLIILGAAIFISAGPLMAFALRNPASIISRSAEISVFGRHLPPEEVGKEITGSLQRDLTMFGITGNPNAEKNPARVPVFDGLISLLAIGGLIILFRSHRKLFWLMLLLSIPPIVSDIFSIEQIPEFHYYGLGHPNTPRLCQFIPWVYFLATVALSSVKFTYSKYVIGLLAVVISFSNLNWYFNQEKIAPDFLIYNWQVNKKSLLEMIDFINKNSSQTSVWTKTLPKATNGISFSTGRSK